MKHGTDTPGESLGNKLGKAAASVRRFGRDVLRLSSEVANAAGEQIVEAFRIDDESEQKQLFGDDLVGDWERIPIIRQLQRMRMCGGFPDRYRNFIDYSLSRWGGKLPARDLRVLIIGCSREPHVEKLLLDTGRVKRIVVVDSDRRRIYNAKQRDLPGVEYVRVDVNCEPLPDEPFHVAISFENLHRVPELEHLFDEIERVLDPVCGLFAAREYLGPSRLQFTQEQLDVANSLLRLLPDEWRMDESGILVEKQVSPSLEYMLKQRPNRAVRTEDIVGIIKNRFKMVEHISLGGTVLSPLMIGIGNNFREPDERQEKVLRAIIKVEDTLVGEGMLPSDYGFIIARKESRGEPSGMILIDDDLELDSEEDE